MVDTAEESEHCPSKPVYLVDPTAVVAAAKGTVVDRTPDQIVQGFEGTARALEGIGQELPGIDQASRTEDLG